MTPIRAIAVLLAAALALGAPPAAAAPLDDFGGACRANPAFFSFAVKGLDAAGTDVLCTCLATGFAAYPDADLAMLTRDLDGTATPADRTAYGDYTDLELRARAAVDTCVATAGLTGPLDPAASADMAGFDASCRGSPLLLEVIGGTAEQAAPIRTALCACLSETFGPRITTAAADILARDLDGSATDESRAAYPGYPALAEMAGGIFEGCFAALRPAP